MGHLLFIIQRYILFALVFFLNACSSIQTQQLSKNLDIEIKQAHVVLVGETHTNFGHHLNQLDIIQKTYEKWGAENGVLSIGLEMVQQPFQSYLDDYIAGDISELDMLRGVEWYSRWGFDFRLYRPIFDFAKQNKIPLVALNIPQELLRKISSSGMQSLSAEERQQLPAFIDKSNRAYTARLKKVFGQHSHGKQFNLEGFERFVDAQLAWDEGMAFAASKYLKKYPEKRIVILAGSGHLINRDGIPSRLDRLLKRPIRNRSVVVLSHEDSPYSPKEADFSLQSKQISLPPAGLIGISMQNSDEGVIVARVTENGAAQKAGLQESDIIKKLNNTLIKTTSDAALWRLDKKPNTKVEVLIRRDQKLLTKTLILDSSS